MDIGLTIIRALSGIGIIICLIGMYRYGKNLDRGKKVSKFRYRIGDMAHDYYFRHIEEIGFDNAHDVYDWFYNKWSENDMLNSTKPLILEEWYTKEELEKINS